MAVIHRNKAGRFQAVGTTFWWRVLGCWSLDTQISCSTEIWKLIPHITFLKQRKTKKISFYEWKAWTWNFFTSCSEQISSAVKFLKILQKIYRMIEILRGKQTEEKIAFSENLSFCSSLSNSKTYLPGGLWTVQMLLWTIQGLLVIDWINHHVQNRELGKDIQRNRLRDKRPEEKGYRHVRHSFLWHIEKCWELCSTTEPFRTIQKEKLKFKNGLDVWP